MHFYENISRRRLRRGGDHGALGGWHFHQRFESARVRARASKLHQIDRARKCDCKCRWRNISSAHAAHTLCRVHKLTTPANTAAAAVVSFRPRSTESQRAHAIGTAGYWSELVDISNWVTLAAGGVAKCLANGLFSTHIIPIHLFFRQRRHGTTG